MTRNKYAMDLLRKNINVEEEVQFMSRKQELTKEDLEEIVRNAEKVKMAAQIRLLAFN